MSEFKVREVGVEEEKSVQEVEEQLLQEHEEKMGAEDENQAQTESVQENEAFSDNEQVAETEQVPEQVPELTEQDVLSFIKNRYDREIDTVDQLFEARESQPELPEDVSAYLKYKQETGRGFEDFIKINRDFDKEDPNRLLLEYYKETNPGLDDEDIQFDMEDKFSYDEDLDDDKDIKKKKVAMKRELAKAKDYFEKQKEQYKIPLESSGVGVSEAEKEQYEAFKSQAQRASELEQEQSKRSEFYRSKTSELFSEDFKGFEFQIGDEKVTYKPAEAKTLLEKQTDMSPFFNSFVDDSGYIKDAAAYHRAMAVAMNPDAMAKFFYEKGKAEAIDSVAKESKNIDMNAKAAPEMGRAKGFSVTALDSGTSNRLKIKSKK